MEMDINTCELVRVCATISLALSYLFAIYGVGTEKLDIAWISIGCMATSLSCLFLSSILRRKDTDSWN